MAVFDSFVSTPIVSGRGSYDTTGTKPPPPKPKSTMSDEEVVGINFGRGSYDTTGTEKPKPTKSSK
ncbi:Uu.00g057660.m01.CDS01 [Anthostomella pinea]|uniref:Uu.00g057660.m01.CDS01 n=1 Tax=Anthostomella pinea TaxID=933095 RepID=A0AAI8VRN5_9PEZI|nr:Uu.00g057660.m01.CDS01 [Anthostomella pinea]